MPAYWELLAPAFISAIVSLVIDRFIKKHFRFPESAIAQRKADNKRTREYGIRNSAGMLCFCVLAFSLNNLSIILTGDLLSQFGLFPPLPLWKKDFALSLTRSSFMVLGLYFFCIFSLTKVDIFRAMQYPPSGGKIKAMNVLAFSLALASWVVLLIGSILALGGSYGN